MHATWTMGPEIFLLKRRQIFTFCWKDIILNHLAILLDFKRSSEFIWQSQSFKTQIQNGLTYSLQVFYFKYSFFKNNVENPKWVGLGAEGVESPRKGHRGPGSRMSGPLAGKSSGGLARGRAESYSFHPTQQEHWGFPISRLRLVGHGVRLASAPITRKGAQSNGKSSPSVCPRPSSTEVGSWPYSMFPGWDKHRPVRPPQGFPQCPVLKKKCFKTLSLQG